ncbi:hypothetical protein AM588_10002112 [Phytophthora nicotianae]|uniref:HTH CENPB-type domain-containing protein n=1 Tax=Phytophthora nicotianae TaxID=4792 RepID=A0A0W8CVR8_PHYNI|nr:hypothetical protein AM588_10002112 [Phytophthora nicotianae]
MVVRRGRGYTKEEDLEALDRANEGEKFAAVARTSSVSLRTLFKKSQELQTTGEIAEKRRGPKPALSVEQEDALVAWIAAMQREGFPVGAARVLERANKINEMLHGATTRGRTPYQPLTKGWYRRFKDRHPELAPRTAQKIARVRNMVGDEDILGCFHAVSTHLDFEAYDMGVWMLTLPPNATHLYQPLDVAVFKPFKSAVVDALQLKLLNTADMVLSKTTAIGIACSAYKTAIIERSTNTVSGFRCAGLYPPSIVNMTKRLKLYTDGGAKVNIGTEVWITRKQEEVRAEACCDVLVLPPAGKASKKARITVDIEGELVGNDARL